jgi:hypothetical protein
MQREEQIVGGKKGDVAPKHSRPTYRGDRQECTGNRIVARISGQPVKQNRTECGATIHANVTPNATRLGPSCRPAGVAEISLPTAKDMLFDYCSTSIDPELADL